MNPDIEMSDFPVAIRVADTVYIGGLPAVNAGGNIEMQTAQSFRALVDRLERAGAKMADLVNLRTYYVYAGRDGRDVTDYWEKMTAVRLGFIADPGPAATALRVSGVPVAGSLIGVDGVAALGHDRQRIMPDCSWDWSIPVPLSQGWRIGDKIYVGGQISADRAGKAIAIADASEQTRITLNYIRHVLRDGGQNWSNVVAMRICFKHGSDGEAARQLMSTIAELVLETSPHLRPSIGAFGVDLLYEGLLLEIDAIARSGERRAVVVPGSGDWAALDGFPLACISGNELHVGGLSAPEGGSLYAQVEITIRRLIEVMRESNFAPSELVKLTLFIVQHDHETRADAKHQIIIDLVRHYLPGSRPVLTFLSVPGLPHTDQEFQLDGLAVHETDRMSF